MGLRGRHRRARPSAGGGRLPGKGGLDAQGLGRSRGGPSTEIHLACDALGHPVWLPAGPGRQGDVFRAAELIEGLDCDFVIADRAYDAEHFHDTILDAGGSARDPTASLPATAPRLRPPSL